MPKKSSRASKSKSSSRSGGRQRSSSTPERSSSGRIPKDVRAPMESAYGHDFSKVTVRQSGEATAMRARAYTQGDAITFAPGQMNFKSGEGKKTLAHELAHVVQQRQGKVSKPSGDGINRSKSLESQAHSAADRAVRGAPTGMSGGGSSAPTSGPIQRLEVFGTNWSQASESKVTTGSGKGVAIISDGSEPVVVKGGESIAGEVIAAGNLMQQVMSTTTEEGAVEHEWTASTTQARSASPEESQTIQKLVQQTAPDDKENKKANFLSDVVKPTTVVFSYVPGKDFEDILKEQNDQKQTKSRGLLKSGRKMNPDSPIAQLIADPGQMTLLGKASAVDIFSGNGDRILNYFNPKNFRIDKENKELILIDNVQSIGASYMHSFTDKQGLFTSKEGFEIWASSPDLKGFLEGDMDSIADAAVQSVSRYNLENNFKQGEQALIKASIEGSLPQMKAWFAAGLQEGKAALLKGLESPQKLVNGYSGADKVEILTNIIIRQWCVQEGKVLNYDSQEPSAKYLAQVMLGELPDL